MRWPWISMVSPSITVARPVKSPPAAGHAQISARARMMGQRGILLTWLALARKKSPAGRGRGSSRPLKKSFAFADEA
jgi:hypothetical protein